MQLALIVCWLVEYIFSSYTSLRSVVMAQFSLFSLCKKKKTFVLVRDLFFVICVGHLSKMKHWWNSFLVSALTKMFMLLVKCWSFSLVLVLGGKCSSSWCFAFLWLSFLSSLCLLSPWSFLLFPAHDLSWMLMWEMNYWVMLQMLDSLLCHVYRITLKYTFFSLIHCPFLLLHQLKRAVK